jgi:hypothetical protein
MERIMSIVVRNFIEGGNYILLGTGFGMYRSERDGRYGHGGIVNEGEEMYLTVCDERGNIYWFPSSQMKPVFCNYQTR